MAFYSGTLDNSNGKHAAYNFLDMLATNAALNGWNVMRNVDNGDEKELILNGIGYSGLEECYVGFKNFWSVANDYYNVEAAVMTGYNPLLAYAQQPGFQNVTFFAHDQRIDYWVSINPRRIVGALRVGNGVYNHFYVGKFLQYGMPHEYPYPVFAGGSAVGKSTTRWDASGIVFPYLNSAAGRRIRSNDNWIACSVYPTSVNNFGGNNSQANFRPVPTNGDINQPGNPTYKYPLLQMELFDANNVYGTLDGIFYVHGFDLTVEDSFQFNNVDYRLLPTNLDGAFNGYIALRED